MKKFLQSLPMATIVLLIFAMISFVWGSDQKRMAGIDENAEIVEIDNDSELDRNEGKLVFLSGQPKAVEYPSDSQFNVKADGFVLVRTVEMYQYTIIDDSVYKHFSNLQGNDIKGKHGEKYINPTFPADLKNSVFFGKMVVGDSEIPISEDYINALRFHHSPANEKNILKDIENLQLKDYKPCGDGFYTKADPNNWKIGDIRIKFSYLPADALSEITVCGTLKSGTITVDENSFSYISDSIENALDVITEAQGEHGDSARGFFLIGIIEIITATIIFIIKKARTKTI